MFFNEHYDGLALYEAWGFSVRSANYLLRDIVNAAQSMESSVGRSCWDKLWQKVWQLKLPNKIKVFAWKACNDILPVMFHGDESNLGLFVALCWGIWQRRNQVIFCETHVSVEATVAMFCNLVSDFGQVQQRIQGPMLRDRVVRWCAPAEGWFKINFDGAWFKELQTVGVGVVIRNSMGEVMGAMSEQLPFWVDADCAEAFAAAKAIELAKYLGFSDIILEGDSLNIVKALWEDVELLPEYGHLVSQVVGASRLFRSFQVCHVGRMGNMLAHGLAWMARDLDHQLVWMEEVPQALIEVVAANAV
ncbi:unnamed protein product [Camellia sinensis]